MIAIIVAIAKNNVIGSRNELPWYLPEDLKRFKQLTTNHTVIMGRKTYESIITRLGKPLPSRKNIVITSHPDSISQEGVVLFPSLQEALLAHKNDGLIFIIGGAQLFAEAIPLADTLYVTHVDKEYDGDVFFPTIDWSQWSKVQEQTFDGFRFADYHKIQKIA